MLSFATEFPITHDCHALRFIEAVKTWILGSPHTRLTPNMLRDLAPTGEASVKEGHESLKTLGVSGSDQDAVAVRYKTSSKGLEWTTTSVFSRTASDAWVRIQVSCETSHPAVRLPPAKKPILVRTLLDEFGGAPDGLLRIGRSPFRLEDTDIDVAAQLIRGEAGCRLPLVYVSAPFQGGPIVDCDRLAADLSAMAHVVVEPNRPFSVRLRLDVGSENVYGGTVGIYWPEGGGRRSFFIGRDYESPSQVSKAVFDEIRVALTNRRPLERCTWASVQESWSRKEIQALQASGSQELSEYIEAFDKELDAKTERIEDAEREIRRLRSELQVYEARLAAGGGGVSIVKPGREQDLYLNETLIIVRDAIADALTRVPDNSRRQHVLESLLKANEDVDDMAESNREELKQILRGTKGMKSKMRSRLEAMGFSITEDGKHYKLVFQGDNRYVFTLPKSGSDWRGGLNAASDIGSMLF
ncbi:MAG TPA: hypothetical protein ENH11_06740 [Candidatus Acetothermia bacterium]|nr:hypothetical protein [Candidatus Acetothermia bacterium]